MSLVDKLEEVHIGDILQLSNPELSVVGYVHSYTPESVKLGHQDPKRFQEWKNAEKNQVISVYHPKGSRFFEGNRSYQLQHFDSYQVLTPKEE